MFSKQFLTISPNSAFILTLMGIYGTTVGTHRMWTHKAFKANGFLKFWLMISQTMAGQVNFFVILRADSKKKKTRKT